jgi:hypothetical protein
LPSVRLRWPETTVNVPDWPACYQYLFCRNAGHSVGNAQAQFLPHAIEWVWRGYVPKKSE